MDILNQKLIEDSIKDVYAKFGKITCTLFNQYGICNMSTALRYFDCTGWVELMRKIKLESPRDASVKRICEDIRCVDSYYNEKSDGLSYTLYDMYGKYSTTTVVNKFGSWHQALLYSGVNILSSRKPKYSKDHLIKCIDDFVDKYGYTPSTSHLDKCLDKFPCSATYYTHFGGSWQSIMKKCGYNYYGMRHQGQDLQWYDSKREKQIADLLFLNKINHIPHRKIDCYRNYRCDFYIPSIDLWIEYDGYDYKRPNLSSYNEKIELYNKKKLRYIIIKLGDNIFELLSEYINLNINLKLSI